MSTLLAEAQGQSASTAVETPTYLAAGPEHVFGITSRPVGDFNGTGVLLLHAGAQNMSAHKGATWARLCRLLSADGFLSFRMDYHGTGDSTGLLVDRRVSGQTSDDVDAAVAWLLSQGAERIAVVASCWGGLVALTAAARYDDVFTACLISPPLRLIDSDVNPDLKGSRSKTPLAAASKQFASKKVVTLLLTKSAYREWVLRRARNRLVRYARAARVRVVGVTHRASAQLARTPLARTPLAAKQTAPQPPAGSDSMGLLGPLIRRQVPVHILVGENEPTHKDLLNPGMLPTLDAASSILDVNVTPVSVHGFATLAAQEAIIDHAYRWLTADQAAVDSSTS